MAPPSASGCRSAIAEPGRLRIGISGAPESSPRTGSDHAARRCRALGIDALEMAWVQKVTISPKGGERIRAAADESGVCLSVHAPYYINLNSADSAVVEASEGRIFAAGRGAAWAGARDVVLHLAYYHDDPPRTVLDRVARGLAAAHGRLTDAGFGQVSLRPELMGRRSQWGDLDEILELCRRLAADGLAGVEPCIDIAHLHARTGAFNTPREFEGLWDAVADALGPEALERVHVHISGIAYGPSGEVKHLPFSEADLDYRGFLEVIHDRGIAGTLVVESPGREDDVLLLQRTWEAVVGAAGRPRTGAPVVG